MSGACDIPFLLRSALLTAGVSLSILGCGTAEVQEILSVTPATVTLPLGKSYQFTAINLASGDLVSPIWFVNGSTGGDTSHGQIDADGTYTAPAAFPADGDRVTISASAPEVADGSATAFLTTFEANTRITSYPAAAYRSETRSSGQRNIASSGSMVVTVWSDNRTGDFDIYLSKSLDAGATFSAPVLVNTDRTSGDQRHPTLALDASGGRIYVAWDDNWKGSFRGDTDIYIASSIDGWEGISAIKINDDTDMANPNQAMPSIAVDPNGLLYAAWEDDRTGTNQTDIFLALSDNLGQSFTKNQRITGKDGSTTKQLQPAMVSNSQGTIFLIWEDHTVFFSKLYLNKITRNFNGSLSVAPAVRIADSPDLPSNTTQIDPAIAIDGASRVYIAWENAVVENSRPARYDIYLASTDDGLEFSAPVKINRSATTGAYGGFAYPAIAAESNGILHIAWEDFRNGLLNKDIYYTRSADAGVSFETERKVNDDQGTWHELPSIAATQGKAAVVWTDYRNNLSLTCTKGSCPNDVYHSVEP